MKGYEVISELNNHIEENDFIVSSNGNISREAYHLLPKPQIYLRGSMGLTVPVGLGLALAQPERRVVIISGDGNFLMGLGSSATVAFYKPKNLKILILDNEKYFTTGGQETVSSAINYSKFLQSLSIEYSESKTAKESEINQDLANLLSTPSLSVLHLRIEKGKKDLANIPWHPMTITEKVYKKLFKNC